MAQKIVTLALACLLAGCANMTPAQKRAAWLVGGVVATSIAISASSDGNNVNPCPTNHWEFRTNGMGWICVAP